MVVIKIKRSVMLSKPLISPRFSISPRPETLSHEDIQNLVPEGKILSVSPILGGHSAESNHVNDLTSKEINVSVDMQSNDEADDVTAKVTISTNINGNETSEEFEIDGSKDEVMEKVDKIVKDKKQD